jgi:hypothetical protein
MGENVFAKLSEQYPFITLCVYAGVEYIGLVQNRDDTVTTIYDFGAIQDPGLRRQFIDAANVWWWESNRSIPINIFLGAEWQPFRSYIRTFSNRDLDIIHGPVCSLADINRKKTKRKSITLVRHIGE